MDRDPEDGEIPLSGGNMSAVVLSANTVRRTATPGSKTIQQFLSHLKSLGIDWVPQPMGFDERGREILGFIEGDCLDGAIPEWFWNEALLLDVARRLRQFHDASASFALSSAVWNWPPMEPPEVIIHRDFAPYNCIFREGRFVGLIDFDLCAPGPRIWDIAYTAYRFVPLMPRERLGLTQSWALSPFNADAMLKRLEAFLTAYGAGSPERKYSTSAVLGTTVQRLDGMVDWIKEWTETHANRDLTDNAHIYANHRAWLAQLFEEV